MIKVSIIVPVFNSEEYLSTCLDSLINQTLDDIEIIAIDDASTDKSLEILKSYSQQYPQKIKIIENAKNLGTGASRNIGINCASGKYIGFVDSDDYVSPTMFEDMYNEALSSDLPDIVSTDLLFVKDNSRLNGIDLNYRGIVTTYNVLDEPDNVLDDSPTSCTKIFRKDFLKDLRFLEGTIWEDVAFTYSALLNADKVVHLNKPNYFYRKRSDSGNSAKGFTPNDQLLNTFIIADAIKDNTVKTGRYERLQKQVKFLQVTTTLQRVVEVLHWDIPNDVKEELCYYLHTKIVEKYTDWRTLDIAALSGRIGIMEIDKLMAIIEKHDKEDSLNTGEVQKIISTYKK